MQTLETVIITSNTRVAEFSLDVSEIGQWHYHTNVIERCYCLEGWVGIDQRGKPSLVIKPGEKVQIETGVIHRLCNLGAQDCRYLVVQGVGRYDFIHL